MPDSRLFIDLIGVPFVSGGRDPERDGGLDCAGLFLLGRKRLGLDVPDVFRGVDALDPRQCAAAFTLAVASGKWARLTHPERGAAAAIYSTDAKFPGVVTHVGLCLDRWRVLHIYKATRSAVIRVDDPFWRNWIQGFYRHVG